MRLSTSTIEEIKARMEIEEVVSDYLSLSRKGGRLWACCPFHTEKTPSFTISPSQGIYKCFGCDKGGDTINFVQEVDRLSYVEALLYLAQRYGIEVKYENLSTSESNNYKVQEGLHSLMSFAAEHYVDRLQNHEEGKSIAHRYFKERDVHLTTLNNFGLGYSLEKGRDFLQTATKLGYTKGQLQQLGLLQKSSERDAFIGRLMFPIHNLSGKVIAFGARAVGNKQPKYINSQETPIYQKNKVLYGIYQARTALRSKKHAYLVEGYIDVIAMAQSGYEETVGVAGTSLTEAQAQLLHRFVSSVTVLFDNDTAGISATLRAIDILLSAGLEVYVVLLPKDKDPDSYLRSEGATALSDYIRTHKQSFLSFKHNYLLSQEDNSPQLEARTTRSVLESIAVVPDELAQYAFIRHYSQQSKMPEALLWQTFSNIQRKPKHSSHPKTEDKVPSTSEDSTSPKMIALQVQEAEILRILLLYGTHLLSEDKEKRTLTQYVLTEMDDIDFAYPPYAMLLKKIKSSLQLGRSLRFSEILSHTEERLQEVAKELLPEDTSLSPQWEKKYNISLPNSELQSQELAYYGLLRLKRAKVQWLLRENLLRLERISSEEDSSEEESLIYTHQKLKHIDKHLAEVLQSTVCTSE